MISSKTGVVRSYMTRIRAKILFQGYYCYRTLFIIIFCYKYKSLAWWENVLKVSLPDTFFLKSPMVTP